MKKKYKNLEVSYGLDEVTKNIYRMKRIYGLIYAFVFAYIITVLKGVFTPKEITEDFSAKRIINTDVFFKELDFYGLVLLFLWIYIFIFIYLFFEFHIVRKTYSVRNNGQSGRAIVNKACAYVFAPNKKIDRNNILTYLSIEAIDIDDPLGIEYRGYPVGTILDKENRLNYLIDKETGNMIKAVGATGGGKTELVILPYINILSIYSARCEQESFILTDPKGQLYKRIAPLLESRGYETIIQNTIDPINSSRVNTLEPILAIHREINELLNGRQYYQLNGSEKQTYSTNASLRDNLISKVCKVLTDDPTSNEKIWQDASYSTLVAWVHFTLEMITREEVAMKELEKTLVERVNNLEENIKERINSSDFTNVENSNKIIELTKELSNIKTYITNSNTSFDKLNFTSMLMLTMKLLGHKTKALKSNALDDIINTFGAYHPSYLFNATSNASAGNSKASILMSLLASLIVFTDSSLASMNSKNNLVFNKLDEGKPKAIFCVVPDDDKSRHKITSIFIEILYQYLRSISRDKKGGKLNRRFNFILEEVANVCDIIDFNEKLSVARGSNIRFMLALQSNKQLEVKYGEGISTIIDQNCTLKQLILSNNYAEIDNFIKGGGNQTVESESVTYNKTNSTPSTRQISLNEKEVINYNEIREIKFTEVFTDITRYPIIKGTLPPSFESSFNKEFNELEKIETEKKNLQDISEINILLPLQDEVLLKDFLENGDYKDIYSQYANMQIDNIENELENIW